MSFDPASFNPLFGNPLRTRKDVENALRDLYAPLKQFYSPGAARLRLSASGANYDQATIDLEAFARPLWGLAPAALGGSEFDCWELYRTGISNGTNPDHPEFWGWPGDRDQRLVELAAIGFALSLVPHLLWDPLDDDSKARATTYFLAARPHIYHSNNWKFFRVLLDLGLKRVDIAIDDDLSEQYLADLDSFYIADGWYRDGNQRRVDHYIPFAMHFYALIYATSAGESAPYARGFRERAALFAKEIRHWYAEDGGTIAYGRSMTYRFACAGIWGMLAYAGIDTLPLSEIKGYYLRHLRWWSDKPLTDRDGVLSIGYGYPNLLMSEEYNAPGSPYWAFKGFIALALPESHPFWQAEELPAEKSSEPVALPHAGMVVMHQKDNVVALTTGQENRQMRQGSEKYLKFAYSSRYAFSIESNDRGFAGAAVFDNALALSDDGLHYKVRERCEDAAIAGTLLYSRWFPWSDVEIESFLLPAAPWHIRVHRITTSRPLQTAEGGFSIARHPENGEDLRQSEGLATIVTRIDFSAIVDIGSTVTRSGKANAPAPNTNLIFSRTLVPQLRATLTPGSHVLISAVVAVSEPEKGSELLAKLPACPDIQALAARIASEGRPISAMLNEQGV